MISNDISPMPAAGGMTLPLPTGGDESAALPASQAPAGPDPSAGDPSREPVADGEQMDAIADAPAATAAPLAASCGYSATDLRLFRTLTGYHLDTRSAVLRAIDDKGQRASIIDRLFTTLAEEAFRFADRQRRTGMLPDGDLTPADLASALAPIRRAAAAVGSRGLGAFERLEAAIARLADAQIRPDADAAEILATA